MTAAGVSIVAIALLIAVATCIATRRQLGRQTQAADVIVALNGVLQTHVDELQARSRDFELLGEMSELLQVSTGLGEACDVLTAFGMALFPDYTGAVLISRNTQTAVESIASWGVDPVTELATADCWALRRGRTHIGSEGGVRCLHAQNLGRTTICLPMPALGEGHGLVVLTAPGPLPGEAVERFARDFSNQIALAVGNLRMQEALRTRAVRDALTGLYNRGYLDEALGRELARAARMQRQVGVILVDIDHFKRFNDTHGHDGGDALLQQFARLAQSLVREEDLVCRYGGEEFLVILPDVDFDTLHARAESLLEATRGLRVHLDGDELDTVTISAGLALSSDRLATAARVITAADRAQIRRTRPRRRPSSPHRRRRRRVKLRRLSCPHSNRCLIPPQSGAAESACASTESSPPASAATTASSSISACTARASATAGCCSADRASGSVSTGARANSPATRKCCRHGS
jgi:diguanylate cyclase (GGDEF)-like protein